MCKTYAGQLHFVVTSITMVTAYVSNLDFDYISCRESKTRCLEELTCRTQFNTIPQVCGESVYACPAQSRLECRSLLSSLQIHPIFRSCSCNPTEPAAGQCFIILNTIFLHNCVTQDGAHLNLSWTAPLSHQHLPSDHLDDEDSDSPDGVSEEDDRDFPSCIGVRKSCLQDNSCNHLLTAYRNLCRENKKQNECVATDWNGCFRTMTLLGQAKPELFDCACPMKRRDTKEKCDRIQWRLANNTCLDTIPYLIHTLKYPEQSYEELANAAQKENTNKDKAGNCIAAFRDCHRDSICRPRLSHLMSKCSLGINGGLQTPRNATRGCDRTACQDGVRLFFIHVRPEQAQGLLFCRCSKGDERCDMVRRSLTPSCSLVELPPPTCLHVIDRCLSESNCRNRWHNFERLCSSDPANGGCHSGPQLCRSSIVGITGTDLTINCTCTFGDEDKQARCTEIRNRLQTSNACIDMAIENFHQTLSTTTSAATEKTLADGASQSDTSHTFPDCGRHIGQKIPSFMTMPDVLRIYTNDTDCSEVCQCLSNRSVICKTLPCLPNESCKIRDVVYAHGKSFIVEERGQCRCIKGETICSKSHIRTDPAKGLFIHVGYSQSDRHLIETSTEIRFNLDSVTSKLSAMLNEDSAEQFCSLSLANVLEGNLVFQVNVSRFSPEKLSGVESCILPATTLAMMITSRSSAIIYDAELSVLKVAQVERVKFHERPETSGEQSELTTSKASTVLFWNFEKTNEARFHCIWLATMNYFFASMWNTQNKEIAFRLL